MWYIFSCLCYKTGGMYDRDLCSRTTEDRQRPEGLTEFITMLILKYSGSPLVRNSYKKLSGSTFRKICSKKRLSVRKYSTKLIFSASQSLKASEKAK